MQYRLLLLALFALWLTGVARAEGEGRGQGNPREVPNRWEAALDSIAKQLNSSKDPGAVAEYMAANNARIQIFHLEALCKIYESLFPEAIAPYHTKVKELEDTLGRFVDANAHIKFAEEVHAGPKVLDILRAERADRKQELVQLLQHGKWLKGEGWALEQMARDLSMLDWLPPAEDDAYIRKQLDRQLKKLQKTKYDLRDLQHGLHELRRQIRWFMLMVEALNGKVLLSDKDVPLNEHGQPKKRFREILQGPLADGPYVKAVKPVQGVDAWYLPKWAYAKLTGLTFDLGAAKDMGEAREAWLTAAIQKASPEKSWKEARDEAKGLIRQHPLYRKVHQTAVLVNDALHERPLLSVLRATVRGERVSPCPWQALGAP